MKLSSSTKLRFLFVTAVVAVAVARLPCADAVAKQEQRELKKRKGGKKNDKKQKNTKSVAKKLSKSKNVVVFGDSLSDIGNIEEFVPCNLNAVEPRVYCGDRASNGLLLYEYLLELLQLPAITKGIMPNPEDASQPVPSGGTNFAISGATVGDGRNDFKAQVLLYTAYQQMTVDPKTLHFLSFGGNDVRQAFEKSSPSAAIQESIADYILNIKRLIDLGACSFLILGPPDVGLAPRIAQPFEGPATELSEFFNLELQKALQEVTIANDDPSCFGIEYIDLQDLTNEVLSEGKFLDTANACNNRFVQECDVCSAVLGQFGLTDFPKTSSESDGKCDCKLPVISKDELDLKCDGFFFFDELHSTTQANEVIANVVFENLSKKKFII